MNLCEIQKKIKEFNSKIGQTPERETVKLPREQNQSIKDVLFNYINNNDLPLVSDENSPKLIIPDESKDIEIVGYDMTTGYISYINGKNIINAKLNKTVGPIPESDKLTIPSQFRYFIKEAYGTRNINTRIMGHYYAEIWDVLTCQEVDYTTIYNKTLVIWNPNNLSSDTYNVEIPPCIVFYFDAILKKEGGFKSENGPASIVSIWKTLEGHQMTVSSAPSIAFKMDTNQNSENVYSLNITNEGDSVTHIFNITTLDGDLLEGEETFNKLMEEANATYILPNPTNSQEHILLKPISVDSKIFVKGESLVASNNPNDISLYDLYRGIVIFNQDTNSIEAQLRKNTIQINIYQEPTESAEPAAQPN